MTTDVLNPWRVHLPHESEDGMQYADGVTPRPDLPLGPFAQLSDGRIAARDGDVIRLSDDGGASWREGTKFAGEDYAPTPEGAIGVSAGDAIVFGFTNRKRKTELGWDDDIRDAPDAVLPCCVARSIDGGATWQSLRTLHDDWTGAVRDMIRTSTGRLVMTSMKMLHNPGRHGCLTYVSDDEGDTWRASNVLDFGGIGHHDGAIEPSVVELRDGTLYMLIRTNWGQFWYALSWDGGEHWHPMGPTGIDAATAPGILLRLQSGRIALVWNRQCPTGGQPDAWLKGGDWHWSATRASNYREELSIAFSEDDCKTWTQPRVVLRMVGGNPSYPFLFEPAPGKLWLTTQANFKALRLELRADAFV